MTTSIGFSAKHTENKLGIMVTTFPLYTNNQEVVTVGITPSYTLRKREYLDVALFVSGCASNISLNSNSGDYFIHSGLGLELDVTLVDFAMWQLLIGYGFRNINDPNNLVATPTIGTGLYFDLFGK